MAAVESSDLRRRLGMVDAVTIGLGSMIGAGIFAALAPAAASAGSGLLIALAIAAVIAYANATSTARLAALHPRAGGAYVYGTERLGALPGFLAGWCFLIGKSASAAAMALTIGSAIAPDAARPIAAAAVIALTLLNTRGVQKSALLTRAIVAGVLAALAALVAAGLLAALGGGGADGALLSLGSDAPEGAGGVVGILGAAGLLFFAFAGYARIATLGEEVREPESTIPRAIITALGIALLVYALVAVTVLRALGAEPLAQSPAPLVDAARALGGTWLVWVMAAAMVVGSVGSLLGLILGISRTAFAMARDGRLPGALAAVHPRFGVPHRAEIAVGVVVCAALLVADLRHAIGFSSFGVLLYYAVANASALTLTKREAAGTKAIPAIGLVGCVLLVVFLPLTSIIAALLLIAVGVVVFAIGARKRRPCDR
ncbi:amino acid permease [Helcobacillus massiliensis]|uniref:APC family permease n=1 Tax=Helcobacillus massiliensis TaxID=521392 RepID=UPI0021A3AF74|nr:amino acid permease [Helcobacillus massiliensis]MCT1558491.1 amino acid permease [Helcobacillus massiliensis]MCT2037261.1 amino acid permease [Helcobacillus massiliensis]MCT2332056.1 amino acid permease [Helcobacillus massiliensis]